MPEKLIIWVDDDNDLIQPQSEYLQENGYHVVIVPDVDQAIDIISRSRSLIYGIILDVMMNPGTILRNEPHNGGLTTGLALFYYLREQHICPPVRAFIFTHRSDPEAANELAAFGISYHQKQHYKGKAICALVEREFDPDETR